MSVKATPVSCVAVLGLRMEKARSVESPVKIGLAANDLEMLCGATTVSEA